MVLLPHAALGIFLIFLVLLALIWLARLLNSFRGLIGVIGFLFFLFAIWAAIEGGRRAGGGGVVRSPQPSYDTLKTSEEPVIQDNQDGSIDQLITHDIQWKDYDSTAYQARLSILRSEVNSSAATHEGLQYIPETSLAPVYNQLIGMDDNKLGRVVNTFDSIRKSRQLDQIAFANMVVSCIQSVPYFLVVDQSCNAEQYQNAFITQYLNQCNADCCIGYAKYGVRSPAEFIGDLKGDCDTRAMIIYAVLKKFNYDVAILTSMYYQHALIAVAFDQYPVGESVLIPIRNKNYLLWETTQAGFRAGDIPEAYRDLDRWTVDLLHEKK